jgi:hypothetical protein
VDDDGNTPVTTQLISQNTKAAHFSFKHVNTAQTVKKLIAGVCKDLQA